MKVGFRVSCLVLGNPSEKCALDLTGAQLEII